MMTNRPEWIAAVFGTSLAGGVAVTLSTFSTPSELKYLLQVSGVSILLFERTVLKRDFAAVLGELEPQVHRACAGRMVSTRFPFLRRLVAVGPIAGAPAVGGSAGRPAAGVAATGPNTAGAIEIWSEFLAHGQATAPELVEATAATVKAANPGVLFFSSGSTSLPKGILGSGATVAVVARRADRLDGLVSQIKNAGGNALALPGDVTDEKVAQGVVTQTLSRRAPPRLRSLQESPTQHPANSSPRTSQRRAP